MFQGFFVFLIIIFAIRESRILWGNAGAYVFLKYFDLAYWGIEISDQVYTLQNLGMIWGAIIILILLDRFSRESPKVSPRSEADHAPEKSAPVIRENSKSGRRDKAPEKHPFEMVNPNWKLVYGNPKVKGDDKDV